jgi:hypothetical protein
VWCGVVCGVWCGVVCGVVCDWNGMMVMEQQACNMSVINIY